MGKKEYVLTIDQGTTGTTVLVVDLSNWQSPKIVGKATCNFKQHFPKADWVEHDLDDIWVSVETAAHHSITIAAETDPEFTSNQIVACGITNQRETIAAFDRKTGKALAHAIVWQCKRSAALCDDLKRQGLEPMITNKTGLYCDPYFSGTKIAWIMDNNKDVARAIRAGTGLIGTIDTYLIHKLTGGKRYVTEASNASRTLLYNIRENRWDSEICDLCRIPSTESLPEVLDSASLFGKTKGISFLSDETPITGVLGDQQAALAGQGCIQPGMAKCTYGTGAFLLLNIGQNIQPSQHGLLNTVAWQLDGKPTYALEGSAFIAGAAAEFLRDQLHLLNNTAESQERAKAVQAAPDIYFVPSLSGLGAPHWRPNVKGGIFGLTRATTSNQIIRACLEGITFQVGELLAAMASDSDKSLEKLRVDGGAAANDLLCSIQADLANVPVERSAILETTAFGAALFAGLGAGLIPSISDLTRVRNIEHTFQPASSTEAQENRQIMWKGWHKAIAAVCAFAAD